MVSNLEFQSQLEKSHYCEITLHFICYSVIKRSIQTNNFGRQKPKVTKLEKKTFQKLIQIHRTEEINLFNIHVNTPQLGLLNILFFKKILKTWNFMNILIEILRENLRESHEANLLKYIIYMYYYSLSEKKK